MCEPVSLSIALASMAALSAYATNKAANKSADAQSKLLTQQTIQRDSEINQAAGQQEDARARAAREERASARVAAAESGVNLGSGSFLALLQTSDLTETNDNGVILKNAENQRKATGIQYQSGLAGLQKKTGLGIALDSANAAAGTGIAAYSAFGGKPYLGKKPGKG